MLLYLDIIYETGTITYHPTEFFHGVVGYSLTVSHHHTMVMFDLLNHFMVMVYPAF